jgi:single-strand DNA-binding protein
MLNQIVCVGRLVNDVERIEENGKEIVRMTLAVQRPYKNEDGIYECDFVDFTLWNAIMSSSVEYIHKGDLIGVKGRIQTDTYETEDGVKHKKTNLIVERITPLSCKDR